MSLLAPDLLADACGLSLPLIITALAVGVVLWLFGWWSHRFWVVLIITVLAGVYGLYEAPAFHSQPVLTALLLALAAGLLALALVRLLAFLAGGMFGLLLVQSLAPAWDQPLLVFLVWGLAGLLLFRLWMMALTSTTGAVLIGYATLCLLNHLGTLDTARLTESRYALLNWLCALLALLGLGFQFWFDRRGERKEKDNGKEKDKDSSPLPILPLWMFRRKSARKAG